MGNRDLCGGGRAAAGDGDVSAGRDSGAEEKGARPADAERTPISGSRFAADGPARQWLVERVRAGGRKATASDSSLRKIAQDCSERRRSLERAKPEPSESLGSGIGCQLELRAGFEPAMQVLQTCALPLRHRSVRPARGRRTLRKASNPAGFFARILSAGFTPANTTAGECDAALVLGMRISHNGACP
jgi:hypothetical protein